MWNATFRLLPASLLLAMGSTGCGTALCTMVICCNWFISIRLLFPSTMVSSGVRWFFVCCWFRCFLSYCRHPRFRYFGSVVPVYVVWVESYVNYLLHFPCLPMAIWFRSIAACVRFRWHVLKPRNSECVRVVYPCRALSFFPAWVVLSPRCRLCRVCMVSCRLRHLACLGGSFGRTSRDLSVVSDLKTVRIPCCCRWRRRGSETPLMYGSTVVDLNYAVSLSGVGFLVLVTFCKKDGG